MASAIVTGIVFLQSFYEIPEQNVLCYVEELVMELKLNDKEKDQI
jgi:hypothetical protein